MVKTRGDNDWKDRGTVLGGYLDLALMIVGVFVLAVAMGSCLIGMVTQ